MCAQSRYMPRLEAIALWLNTGLANQMFRALSLTIVDGTGVEKWQKICLRLDTEKEI
jgi:hypothetical protein